MPRFPVKLSLYLVYLGAVISIAALIIYRARAFDGLIVVEHQRAERWVVRPVESGNLFTTAHRNLPGELIDFDNPRAALRVLDARDAYDATRLPFTLYLEQVDLLEEVPDIDVLEIIQPGESTEIDVARTASVEIPEGVVIVKGVRPWAGLLRDGRGGAMALTALKLDKGDWQEPIFFGTNGGVRPFPGTLLLLRTFPDEAVARAAPAGGATEPHTTRWAVRENGRVHQFDTLSPGTGVTTAAGVEYTLLEVLEDDDGKITHILLGIKNADGTRIEQIAANAESADGAVFFERYANNLVVLLRAWRDGAALVTPFVNGEALPETLLNENETMTVEGSDNRTLEVRLDQLMMRALAVHGTEDSVRALALDTPGGVVRLREGMSTQLEETRLRYRRRPQPPVVRYELRASFGRDKPARSFTLTPGGSTRIDGWRFAHDQENIGAASVAVLRATRAAATPAQLIGALLFIIGATGLAIARFGRRRREHEDAAVPALDDTWTAVGTTEKQAHPDSAYLTQE